MAIEQEGRPCTIVLHDDRVAKYEILAGSRILHVGGYAWLTAPGARKLCVAPAGEATNSLEVSVHVSLAKRFGFENRTQGRIQLIDDVDAATATHVELFFREQYLSRADMWQLIGCVQDTVIYKGQIMNYLGSETAEVKSVFISGNEVDSAISLHPHTKPIYRSGSARYTVLVEVSREMLETWMEGDLMYERLVDGFLPELFKRQDDMRARHQISVILFGRARTIIGDSNRKDHEVQTEDFFHVVKSEAASHSWPQILRKIKRAFNELRLPRSVSLAAESNMLEAIHLSALDFADDQTDTHLMSRGNSIIAVTAGPGLFHADRTLLKQTTDLLIGNSIGVDVVSLAPKPLHPVPLFEYDNNGTTEFALPHWVDISFWKDHHEHVRTAWNLSSIKGPLNAISLPILKESGWSEIDTSIMDYHDNQVFQDVTAEATVSLTPSNSNANTENVGSVETMKGIPIPRSSPRKTALPEITTTMKQEVPSKDASNAPTQDSLNRAKRQRLGPHPLMQFGRKISLGPKGLAPTRSVASTTVSVAHASYGQHDKEIAMGTSVGSADNSSGLARAIRASLARKPSQQTLSSHRISTISDPDHASTRPIDIHTGPEVGSPEVLDPAGDVEQKIADTMVGTVLENNISLSATPKAGHRFPRKGSMNDSLDMLAPWVMLLNPCHPRRDNMRIASQYRKWQHVFPRAISSGAFKWASMCSPAALPLTAEYKPSASELETHHNKKVRRHIISHSTGLRDETAKILVEKLIDVRLIWGFQIVAIRNSGSDQTFQSKNKPILMSRGRQYHEIQRLSDFEVQIVQYEPKAGIGSEAMEAEHYLTSYEPQMCMTTGATIRAEISYHSDSELVDWTPLDEYILGLSPLPEQLNATFKLRFLLIPVSLSKAEQDRLGELTENEKRIDGIQRLTQAWQRQKYISIEDKQHHASLTKTKTGATPEKRDPNPLAIEYQTKDPSMIVNAHGPTLSTHLEEGELNTPLFADSEKHHSSNYDIAKLVKQMQELPPFGVDMRDRRWLTLTHLKCFRGDEMTTWLLGAFKDLELREDAEALGNDLMDRGVFHHVRNKHKFRDGHYFYQISSAHRTTDYPDTQGLFSKAPWKSVPATPISESVLSPGLRPVSGDSSSSSSRGTPVTAPIDTKKLLLSQVMHYNVDPSKRSTHLQIISLHYDRIHNPENCYHIQLEWLGTSTKLVREALSHWARLVEGYGLKLVQVPLQEACKFRERHPFDQPQPITLAVKPPSDNVLATPIMTPRLAPPRPVEDGFAYHKAILRHNDFALDYEAASAFTSELHVTYSWGLPSYTYTQFVHKSGLVLAQIAGEDNGDFLLLPNRLATKSIITSTKQNDTTTVESITKQFKDFCSDGEGLGQFYAEIGRPPALSPSPYGAAASSADSDVPPMSLPPRLALRVGGHRQAMKDVLDRT